MSENNLEETCRILNENPIFGKKTYIEKDDDYTTNRFIKYYDFVVKDSKIFSKHIILYVYSTNIELSNYGTYDEFTDYEKKFILEHETISEQDFNEVLQISQVAVEVAKQIITVKFKK